MKKEFELMFKMLDVELTYIEQMLPAVSEATDLDGTEDNAVMKQIAETFVEHTLKLQDLMTAVNKTVPASDFEAAAAQMGVAMRMFQLGRTMVDIANAGKPDSEKVDFEKVLADAMRSETKKKRK